jgi:hypothetical protein
MSSLGCPRTGTSWFAEALSPYKFDAYPRDVNVAVYVFSPRLPILFFWGHFRRKMPWRPWRMGSEKCYAIHGQFLDSES